jgi:hypothetical protein
MGIIEWLVIEKNDNRMINSRKQNNRLITIIE